MNFSEPWIKIEKSPCCKYDKIPKQSPEFYLGNSLVNSMSLAPLTIEEIRSIIHGLKIWSRSWWCNSSIISPLVYILNLSICQMTWQLPIWCLYVWLMIICVFTIITLFLCFCFFRRKSMRKLCMPGLSISMKSTTFSFSILNLERNAKLTWFWVFSWINWFNPLKWKLCDCRASRFLKELFIWKKKKKTICHM